MNALIHVLLTMKKLTTALALFVLTIGLNAQIMFGDNPNDQFRPSLWTNNNNTFRVIHNLNQHHGTNTFDEAVLSALMATEQEVTNTIASLAVLNGGSAGGVLSGTYPNPSFNANAQPLFSRLTLRSSSYGELNVGTWDQNETTYLNFLHDNYLSWMIRAESPVGDGSLRFHNVEGEQEAPVLELEQDGDVKIGFGYLQVGQNPTAETPTATHTILIKSASGQLYKLLCVPVN